MIDTGGQGRSAQLAAGLAGVERRIVAACSASGRPRADVTLVVVTKTWPVEDIRALADLGVTDVGENRDAELAGKREQCEDLPLVWHAVGQVQTNKARSVAAHADWVHSVDRARLATSLSAAAATLGRTLTCLLQVSLDPSGAAAGRGGAAERDVRGLAALVGSSPGLRLGGVMGVAPREGGLAAAAEAFARLGSLALALRADHPAATAMSAGMSEDLEAAVAAGATHLRVGTAVLGSRPPLR